MSRNCPANRDPVVNATLFFLVPLADIGPIYISILLDMEFTTRWYLYRFILAYIHSVILSGGIQISSLLEIYSVSRGYQYIQSIISSCFCVPMTFLGRVDAKAANNLQ